MKYENRVKKAKEYVLPEEVGSVSIVVVKGKRNSPFAVA
jgi:hypothetical protein